MGKERDPAIGERPPGDGPPAADPLDGLLDEALASVPLARLPAGFTARTLARLGPAPAPLRPRLTFLDLALPAFLALSTLLALALATLAGTLDPALGPRLAAYGQAARETMLPGMAIRWDLALAYGAALAGIAILLGLLALDQARGPGRAR